MCPKYILNWVKFNTKKKEEKGNKSLIFTHKKLFELAIKFVFWGFIIVLNFFVVPAAPLADGFVKIKTLFALITLLVLPCSIPEPVVVLCIWLLSFMSYLKSLLSSDVSVSCIWLFGCDDRSCECDPSLLIRIFELRPWDPFWSLDFSSWRTNLGLIFD